MCLLVLGIQGPVIVAQAGDRVVVHFKNLASQPYSISPVGITYGKQSEGSEQNERNCRHPLNMNLTLQHSVLLSQGMSKILTQLFD